jgi:hypothetical protein
MNFVEELTWRGMLHDMMPGTEEQLKKEMTSAYVGIDPTADSLAYWSFSGSYDASPFSESRAQTYCIGRWGYRYDWGSIG